MGGLYKVFNLTQESEKTCGNLQVISLSVTCNQMLCGLLRIGCLLLLYWTGCQCSVVLYSDLIECHTQSNVVRTVAHWMLTLTASAVLYCTVLACTMSPSTLASKWNVHNAVCVLLFQMHLKGHWTSITSVFLYLISCANTSYSVLL